MKQKMTKVLFLSLVHRGDMAKAAGGKAASC